MPDVEKSVLNALLKGAAFSTIGIFFSKAMGYLYRIIVGRYIGPEAYGQLAVGLMILGFAKAFSGDSLGNALKKYIPEYRNNGDKASIKGILLSTINISLLLSIIVGIIVFFSAEYIAVNFFEDPGLTNIIRLFGLMPIIVNPYERLIATTLGFNTTKYRVLTRKVFQNSVKIFLTILFVFVLGLQLWGAIWAYVISTVLSTLLAFYFVEKKLGPVLLSDVKPNYQHKKIINYSYPLMMSGVVGKIQGWTDTAVIGFFMSSTSIGIYNAALPTAMLIMIPSQALGSLALSSLSEIGENSEKSREDALRTLTNWTFALVFPAFLLMILFSEQVITLLFGKEYLAGATALSILAFSNVVSATVGKIGSFFKSKDNTKIILYNTLATVVLNIILNIILVPRMGITGAAIATATSGILGELLIFAEARYYENVSSLHPKMLRTVFSGLISLGVVYVLITLIFTTTPQWVLFPGAAVFFLLHFTIFLKIGGLTEYDKEIIMTTGRKIGREKLVKKTLKILT